MRAVFRTAAQGEGSGLDRWFRVKFDVVADEELGEPDGWRLICEADADFSVVRIEDVVAMAGTVHEEVHGYVDLLGRGMQFVLAQVVGAEV